MVKGHPAATAWRVLVLLPLITLGFRTMRGVVKVGFEVGRVVRIVFVLKMYLPHTTIAVKAQ